jgi:hypothetical protein
MIFGEVGAETDAAFGTAIVVAGLAETGGTEEAFAVGMVAADGVVVNGLEGNAAFGVYGSGSLGSMAFLCAEIAEAEFGGMEFIAFLGSDGGKVLIFFAEVTDGFFLFFNVDKAFNVRHQEGLASAFAADELFFGMFAHVAVEERLREVFMEKEIRPVGIAVGAARIGTFGHLECGFGAGLAHLVSAGLAFTLHEMAGMNVFLGADAAAERRSNSACGRNTRNGRRGHGWCEAVKMENESSRRSQRLIMQSTRFS